MRIPLSWLKEYVTFDLPTDELVERLTLAGLEVEGVEAVGDWWDPETIRVGEVIAVHPHPDADRLVLVDVDFGGDEPDRVVTGAPNLFQYKGCSQAEGNLPVVKAPFARSGAVLFDAYSDETPRPKKKLKPSKIRGVKSSGMVCSERELGLSEEHEGILLLPDDAPTGMPLRDYLNEVILELELTPDMSRCLNMIGVAREVAALTGGTLTLPEDELAAEGDDQVSEYFDVQIDNPELCGRFTGHLIRDVEIGDSPKWMQERLLNAGMRPINNIVDITNYVMLEWGQPLHAFDYDILVERAKRVDKEKPVITVKLAANGEKFTTLDDKEHTLNDSMLMVTDDAGSLAVGGIMGGQESEVSETTRNVLLEAAIWDGINNRRTSMALRIPSDASHRFARGIPPKLSPIAARRAAEMMRLYAGGRIVPGMIDTYPRPQEPIVLYTTETDNRRILGVEVTLEQIADALRTLDFDVKQVDEVAADASADATFAMQRKENEPLLEVTAPWHRLDMRYPADLTEEVARIIGYGEIDTTLINDVLPPQRRDPVLETEERLRDILVGIGLQEVINHPLTTVENHQKLIVSGRTGGSTNGANQADSVPTDVEGFVTLTNPGTPERQSMRRSMLVSAMENLAYNLRFTSRLANFEIGRIYLPEEGDGQLPHEERRVTITMTGERQPSGLYAAEANGDGGDLTFDFFDLKGVIEAMLDALGFKAEDIEYLPQPNTGTFGPRCAEVKVKGKTLGLIGEMHPQVSVSFGLGDNRVAIADLLITPLIKPEWAIEPMQPISNYPAVMEDMAFVVAENVQVQEVEAAIYFGGGDLLTDVELFDIYRGDSLPANHKSLAYRLTYQRVDRTLSEKEINKARQRVIRSVEKAVNGELRG